MKVTLMIATLLGLAVCTLGRVTCGDQRDSEWNSYKDKFNKIYTNDEDSLRMAIFQDNKEIIERHNARWVAGDESYEMTVSQFTDMLPREISEALGKNDEVFYFEDLEDDSQEYVDPDEDFVLESPAKVNWTAMGAVTPVMNQGHFNNSWAFAAAGVVESRKFLTSGKLVALSKQDLIDCCHGRFLGVATALVCIKRKHGIDTESSYVYRGVSGKCQFKSRSAGAKIKKIFQVRPGNERRLALQVSKGPVAAVISQSAIINYKRGVFNNPSCGLKPSFAVLIVGYGSCKNLGDYWIIKTSLGTQWGEKGYMRLARNRNNLCGITNRVFYPKIA